MENKIRKMLQSSSFAVAGSFRSKSKYAYKILLDLLEREKEVYPVNPRGGEVEGMKCWVSVNEIPVIVDVVSLVTTPTVTESIVRQCLEKGIKNIWMQPGAESKEAISFCENNGINVVHDACLLLNR